MNPNRRKNDQSLKEAIQQLISAYRLNGKLNEAKIVSSWEKIMGKGIAARTRNIYVRKGVLFLTIDSAPLKQELFMGKAKIVDLLNQEVGEEFIKEVIFQ